MSQSMSRRFALSIKPVSVIGIVPLGERRLRGAIREYVEHYHREQHYQGIGSAIILVDEERGRGGGQVRRCDRLGGVLNHHYKVRRSGRISGQDGERVPAIPRKRSCQEGPLCIDVVSKLMSIGRDTIRMVAVRKKVGSPRAGKDDRGRSASVARDYVLLNVRVPRALKADLDALCFVEGASAGELGQSIVGFYLRANRGKARLVRQARAIRRGGE